MVGRLYKLTVVHINPQKRWFSFSLNIYSPPCNVGTEGFLNIGPGMGKEEKVAANTFDNDCIFDYLIELYSTITFESGLIHKVYCNVKINVKIANNEPVAGKLTVVQVPLPFVVCCCFSIIDVIYQT